jgi:eukaryotic translation initiation factor 2C
LFIFRAIKTAGDSKLGIITQCLVATSAGITRQIRGQDQYIANVAMKVNAKLGGTNVTIHSNRFPLIGASPFIRLSVYNLQARHTAGPYPVVPKHNHNICIDPLFFVEETRAVTIHYLW